MILIDVTNKGIEFDKLDQFCDLFNLINLVTSPTSFTKIHKPTTDLILTNKGNCFQKTKVTESTFLGLQFNQLNSEAIYYRNDKKFNEQKFLEDVKNTNS